MKGALCEGTMGDRRQWGISGGDPGHQKMGERSLPGVVDWSERERSEWESKPVLSP